MAEFATGKMSKSIDLKYQPGFSQIAWFCIVVLYAPIAVLVLFSFNQNLQPWQHW
jgi:spermidine/putrescine transport system permease protein